MFTILSIFFIILFSSIDANAHSLVNSSSGFGSGFSHPMLGLDHFLAMFGVGVWGAQMGGRRIWSLPISFPLIMCIGALIAISKVYSFVLVEQIIALSVIVLGFVIFLKWSPNELIAILIISISIRYNHDQCYIIIFGYLLCFFYLMLIEIKYYKLPLNFFT